jgi:hypothetical protein
MTFQQTQNEQTNSIVITYCEHILHTIHYASQVLFLGT